MSILCYNQLNSLTEGDTPLYPSQCPRSVREAWGKEAAEDFTHWLDQVIQQTAVPRDEYRHVLSRLDILEHDVTDIKQELKDLHREMNERFDRMNECFDEMYDRIMVMTRWTIGVIALFGAAVTLLLAIAQFKP